MSTIPGVIKHADLLTAMAPLLELIGASADEILIDSPITIDINSGVRFTALREVRTRVECPALARDSVVGEGEFAMNTVDVTVAIAWP